jgi:hypothetical protein
MATYDVTAQNRRVQYNGNGSAGPFAFTFQVNATDEIKVFVDSTEKQETTHYTVTLNSSNGSGSVSFTTGNFPTSSQKVTLLGDIPLTRTSVYTSGGQLTSASLESDFDTSMFIHQQTNEELDRAIRQADHDILDGANMTLPVKADRLGKLLGFNSTTGNPEMFSTLSLSLAGDSGTASIDTASGQTLTIAGGVGIDTTASNQTITISGEDASTTNKGIANYSSTYFSVTGGTVSLDPNQTGLTEIKNSSIKIARNDDTFLNYGSLGELQLNQGSEGVYLKFKGTSTTSTIDLPNTKQYFKLSGKIPNTNIAVDALSINFSNSGGNAGDATFAKHIRVPNGFVQIGDSVLQSNASTSRTVTLPDQAGTVLLSDSSGNVTVSGNLTVSGTTTTVDSTTVNIGDHNIVLDSDNTTSAVVNGAGITIEGGTGDDATFTYNTVGPKFEMKLGSSYEDLQVDTLIASSVNADLTGTIQTASQPNITSLGTLTSLNTGTITTTDDLTAKTSNGAILKLQTSDTDVGNNEVLGAIEFSAPDEFNGGDAILTSASIVAEADASFKANVNKTDLVFKLGSSGVATEKMRLTHEGNLEVLGNIELGHATDTTIARSSAGVVTIEGAEITTNTATQTLTNKTLTSPKINEDVVVTSTATELNILDGVTATTAEINKLDGVTATTTELNYVDVSTLGTVEASKAVTADANGDVKFPDSDKAVFGSDNDLEIYHDGSNGYIDSNNRHIYIRANVDGADGGDIFLQGTSGVNNLLAVSSGATFIHYNGTIKIRTTTTGAEINGGILDIKNDGSQSELRLYCESANAHYVSLQAPAHADFSGNQTLTLPAKTGTLISTSNSDTPTTTTSSSDADFVLIDDGGTMKKITPSNLGIGGGSGSITVQDEGSALSTEATTLNFVGAGVTASGTGSTKTITISGGGGSGGTTSETWGASLNGKLNIWNTSKNIDIGAESNSASGEPSSALTGVNNTVIGYEAQLNMANANNNVAIGYQSNKSYSSGYANGRSVYVGAYAGTETGVSGNIYNTCVGYYAGQRNRGYCTSIGYLAGRGYYNPTYGQLGTTALGYQAGYNNSSFFNDYNTSVGYRAGIVNQAGDYNIHIGYQAWGPSTGQSQQIAIGREARATSNTISIGYRSGYSMDSGSINSIMIGYEAGYDLDGSDDHVIIGYRAGYSAVTGNILTGIGKQSLYNNTSGNVNVAYGPNSLYNTTSGGSNVGLGYYGGNAISTGDQNTAVGTYAMGSNHNLITGSNNTALGYDADPSSTSVSNEITLGNASVTSLRCQVQTISSLSDRRDKTAIEDLDLGLDFIKAMKPRKFAWNRRDGKWHGKKEVGFIAQELHEVEMDFNSTDRTRLVSYEDPSKLEARPMNTYPILVKAIQELSAKVDSLQARITELEGA